jgi:hypothetical protein
MGWILFDLLEAEHVILSPPILLIFPGSFTAWLSEKLRFHLQAPILWYTWRECLQDAYHSAGQHQPVHLPSKIDIPLTLEL